jgi:hypothetical protein
MEKCKACPFCGNVTSLTVILNTCDDEYCKSYAVLCDYTHGGCGATGGYRESDKEAIAVWNLRLQDVNSLCKLFNTRV